ncbi:DMT family transporter [Ramlibacter tataouinensis]|uniref:DMT family transporter n=1 Tax=Ramlibacter tataouinensis TaxID=94132 RepID=UPI0022F3915F|nr:DMT family transporter [Ramlibacter tataouinensis]WBY03243.1 DMT family transporter [Ramlibacter tataouinensis]
MSAAAIPRPRSAGAELAGIALVLAACACFAALDTTTKVVSASVPMLMALWVRYAFQAVATTAAVLPARGLAALRTRHLPFQCLRGVLLLASSMFAFLSLRYLPVGEFTAIMMIAPLVVTLLAATFLKETVSPLRWTLVAGGFAGTLVIIRPGGEGFTWVMLLPLGLVATNAWFQVITSQLARTEDPVTMHLYTGWVGTLLASAVLPTVWVSDLASPWLWAGMGFMGLTATVGHFLLILAYRNTPASTLTPYLYSQIGFAMLGGWLVFAHMPDGGSLIGMGLIALCGAAGAWLTVHESRSGLRPARA